MSDIRETLDECERAVTWMAYPDPRQYGPGYTANEIRRRHEQYLRSGWSRAGSGAYHNVRVAPMSEPPSPWRSSYPGVRIGVDPWHSVETEV